MESNEIEKSTLIKNLVSDDKWKMLVCCYVIGTIHCIILLTAFILRIYPLVIFNALSIAMYLFIATKIIKLNKIRVCAVAIIVEISMHSVLCMYVLGWESGFQLYLLAALEIFSYMIYREGKQKSAVIAAALSGAWLAGIFCLCYWIGSAREAIYIDISIRSKVVSAMYVFNALTAFVGVGAYITFFALENYYYRSEIEKRIEILDSMSSEDETTGLYNRRSMNVFFNSMINQGVPFFVMTCTIDNMEQYSDNNNTAFNSFILSEIANIIKNNLRGDYVSRWGTEEYLVAVVTDSAMQMSGIAERIRKKIENEDFIFNGEVVKATITAGVCKFEYGEDNDKSLKDCIYKAESKMYSGIRKHKNIVVV